MFSREYDKLALFAQTATPLIGYYWIQLCWWIRFAKHKCSHLNLIFWMYFFCILVIIFSYIRNFQISNIVTIECILWLLKFRTLGMQTDLSLPDYTKQFVVTILLCTLSLFHEYYYFFVKVWITRFGAANRLEMCVDGTRFVRLCCA